MALQYVALAAISTISVGLNKLEQEDRNLHDNLAYTNKPAKELQ